MTNREIIGVIEIVASFHLITSGAFLLIKKTKDNKAFQLLGVFLFILGLHFFLLFIDIFLELDISPLLSSLLLFSYGPLLYSFTRAYAKLENVKKRSLVYCSLPIVYFIFWSLFLNEGNQTFFHDSVSVPIYISNFIFTGTAIWITLKSELKVEERNFSLFINCCFFAMLLIYFSLSIFLEVGIDTAYLPFKLAFLVVLLSLAEGMMFVFIKFPHILVDTQHLRFQIKNYEAPVYAPSDVSYDAKIIQALHQSIVEQEYYKKDIRLKDVSDIIGFPSYDLSKAVSRQLKMNFKQYLNGIRISKAAELLQNDNLKVSQAMNHVGFNSKSRFFDIFQKEYGTTPGEYQRSHQSSDNS